MNELNKALEYYEKALKIDKKFVYALHAWNNIKKELNLSLGENPDFEKKKNLTEKLKALLKMSKRVKIQMIQDILELDNAKTLELLIDWGKKYDCEINGDYLTIDKEKLPALLASLNKSIID